MPARQQCGAFQTLRNQTPSRKAENHRLVSSDTHKPRRLQRASVVQRKIGCAGYMAAKDRADMLFQIDA